MSTRRFMNKRKAPLAQGDIILVPFPFTDLSSAKTRPAVVISKTVHGEDVVVCAVTSKSFRGGIRFFDDDLSFGKLPVVSYIRPEKVVTLHLSLVRQKVARLGKKKLAEFVKVFKNLF